MVDLLAKIGRWIGLYGFRGGMMPLETEIIISVGWVTLTIIFGTCFGLIYSKAHEIIPGKGIRKGLYFGLLIWFIKDIAAGAYLIFVGTITPTALWIAAGVSFVVLGLYMWVIYGLVLGALYRKPSD